MGIYKKSGFTLAEIIIAFSILGVISTFLVLKMTNGANETKKKAIFRETISTLQTTLYQARQDRQYRESANIPIASNAIHAYLRNKLSAVKTCTNPSAEGCWAHAYGGGVPPTQYGAYVLHNGAVVVMPLAACFGACSLTNGLIVYFDIDWNGSQGPNQWGEDQMEVYTCAGFNDSCSGMKSGLFAPVNSASIIALYNEIME
jgi:prepilin-type N-terminal cleavage/methylation domain-containing protein